MKACITSIKHLVHHQGPSTWIHLPSGGRYLGRVRRSCVQGVPWPNFSSMRGAGKKHGDSQYETWFQMKTWKNMWPQCQNPRTEYVRSNDVWCDSSGDLDILNMRGHQLWHFSQQCVCMYIYIFTVVRWWRTRVNAIGQADHGLCRSSHSNSNLLKLY